MAKRVKGGPRAPKGKVGKELVKSGGEQPAAPPRALAIDVGAIVFEANTRIRAIGLQHEALCVYLVNAVFGGDAHAALSKEALLDRGYIALRARAGKSLEMTVDDLREHTRIGAIHLLRPNDDAWRGVGWSEKLELLPLLSLPDDRKKFNEGVAFAARANVGLEHVRKFVQAATPRLPGSPGRPRGGEVSVAKSSKFAETGVQLGNARHREQLAKKIDAAPPAKRRELVRDLKRTLQNLAELLKLVEDDGGDDDK